MNLEMFHKPQSTPVQLIDEFPGGRRLFIKREDLIHPQVSGNKWHKLKYNFQQVLDKGLSGVVTFGGAYSNHIYATAAAGYYCEVPTVGFIRGELEKPLNPTLKAAQQWGMQLIAMDRARYREKTHPSFLNEIQTRYPTHWVIPEGGTNEWALRGCQDLVPLEGSYDYWCVSCGTAGTMAGLATALSADTHLLGFPALKGAGFLVQDLSAMWQSFAPPACTWDLQLDYHFGGYAKTTEELLDFIQDFKNKYQIELDPIYTGKMLFGVFELLKRAHFRENSHIMVLHSGGLQGLKGFEEKYGKKIF